MEIKFDKVADVVYVCLGQGRVAKTLEMNDRLNVDIDAAGNVMGIEILDASSQKDLVGTLQKNVAGGVPIEIIASTPAAA